MLILGKPMLDGERNNWANIIFCSKYEPHEASLCNIHVIPKCLLLFLSGLRRGQKWTIMILKISWATYSSRTILDSAKQTKWNLWD